MPKNLTSKDVDLLEQWWVEKSRKNFFAYRQFIRHGEFKHNWFTVDLCRQLQQFYVDYLAGKRPVLIINTPPQHGKSLSLIDFITWVLGLDPTLRIIFASFSERLGVRCNLSCQRIFDQKKYKDIFPGFNISVRGVRNSEATPKRTDTHLDIWNDKGQYGYFRNTTVEGQVTGETLDIGVIDDPVKGRAEANSALKMEKAWDWFNDDFMTRFSEFGGLLVFQTRWGVSDLTGKIVNKKKNVKVINYQAIATKDEKYRKAGEPLFPELKSLDFILDKKSTMTSANFESLYQGNPVITGGNMFKDEWWKWWKTGTLPPLKYKFITADTAQKTKTVNDWTCFHCWGYGIDGRLYLLDKFRNKLEAPELRREALVFYKKHDTLKAKVDDPTLRKMWIEDKSSGVGLIQELERHKVKVGKVPRNTDKILRADDVSPYIESGRVVLNTEINGIGNLTKEAREFPNSEFDDDIDCLITAVEIAFINKKTTNSLRAAMEA